MNKLKLILSSAYASIITILFIVIITILAELFIPLKDWLKNFSGHHWVSKSIFSVLLYIVSTKILYLLIKNNDNNNRVKKSLKLLIVFVVLGIIAITIFYTGHH